MMPAYVALWNWFANNPIAQGIAAAGIVVAMFLFWLARHDAKVRKYQAILAEKRARQTKDKVLKQMEEESDDRIESAERARERVDDDITSDSVPDDDARILFRD